MDYVHLHTIYPVSIIPLFSRLADWELPWILSSEYLCVDTMPDASSHSYLHLIMRVVRPRVEDVDLIVVVGRSNITLP
jgi:hypothetical protein